MRTAAAITARTSRKGPMERAVSRPVPRQAPVAAQARKVPTPLGSQAGRKGN
jgi:hypothetical protein